MVKYDKRIYPEINSEEFDIHIKPVLENIQELGIKRRYDFKESEQIIEQSDRYPYHNSCLFLITGLWNQQWDNSMNYLLADFSQFHSDICESLANIAFSYFIRCFAEQITELDEEHRNYEDYNKSLKETNYKIFYERYPIVWYRCNELLINSIKSIIQLLKAVENNRDALYEKFNIDKHLKIHSIEVGGDTHNNGKSVSVITFDEGKKVIHKPRTVKGEVGYATFVNEMNKSFDTDFKGLEVLDLQECGFVSYVIEDRNETDLVKAGEIACLMYMLNATDMHYSNILWTKEGPVPIDLETLFHIPRVKTGLEESEKSAYSILETSVYSTGVLPIHLGKTKNAVDVGFAGIRDKNSVGPIKAINIKDGFTENIKVVWSKVNEQNSPVNSEAQEKEIYDNCEKLVIGFKRIYNKILLNKDLFKKIVQNSFDGVKLRYIHNMTYRYEQILRSMTSPQAACNIDVCHTLMSRAAILSLTSDKAITVSECEQLWRGDVPYFSVDFCSNEIKAEEKVVSKSISTPKESFERKMDVISTEDLARQVNIIRLAFVSKLSDPHSTEGIDDNDDEEMNNGKFERSDVLNVIEFIADKLKISVTDDHYSHLPVTWIGPVIEHTENTWIPGVLGYDLYSGRIGPGVALAMAGKLLENKEYSQIAYRMFNSAATIIESGKYEIRNLLVAGVGFFSGFTSIIWGINEAGKIFEKEEWCNCAKKSFDIIDKELNRMDENFFDMISGKSTSIIFRLKMDSTYKLSDEQIDIFVNEANRKLDNIDKMVTSGLAHGITHYIWFFSILYQSYPNEKILEIIKKADSIIKDNYTSDDNHILIYSGIEDKESTTSWCNGLAGVLLAYYEAYKAEILDRDDVIHIINEIKRSYISNIPIYCHGTLGIINVLEYISLDFSRETKELLERIKSKMCSPKRIYKYFKEEKGRYTLSPGYMSGQSGSICFLSEMIGQKLSVNPLTFRC